MKLAALVLLASILSMPAQEAHLPASRVVESGPDYSVWEHVEQIDTPEGLLSITNRPIQVESGLNIVDAKGQWGPASPRLEVTKDGLQAVASHLQFHATFASSAAADTLFDVTLPDGNRLAGRVLGLAYVDQDGSSILIAQPVEVGGILGGVEQN